MLNLTRADQQFLEGAHGEAARFAMSVIVKMAEAVEATELVSVEQAHIDACALMSQSSLDFIRHLRDAGGRVVVPTTLSMVSLDLEHWERLGVPQAFAAMSSEIARAYLSLGCIPTWTCAPYQGYLTPRFGQQIAWGESNAVAYANSVLGARTNRYADFLDICAGLTGRVPFIGLHRTECRRATLRLDLSKFSADESWNIVANWAVLGSLVGKLAGEAVPVLDGLRISHPANDMLKAFGAAAASTGSVGLYHIVGMTPEANTLDAACQGVPALETMTVERRQLRDAWIEQSTGAGTGRIDAVILGCPHFSYAEFEHLAQRIRLARGRRVHANVQFLIFSGATDLELARRGGLLEVVERFGATLVRDTCPFHSPVVAVGTRAVVTNSGKCAYYAPGELNVDVRFASLDRCVEAAIRGSLDVGDPPW